MPVATLAPLPARGKARVLSVRDFIAAARRAAALRLRRAGSAHVCIVAPFAAFALVVLGLAELVHRRSCATGACKGLVGGTLPPLPRSGA